MSSEEKQAAVSLLSAGSGTGQTAADAPLQSFFPADRAFCQLRSQVGLPCARP